MCSLTVECVLLLLPAGMREWLPYSEAKETFHVAETLCGDMWLKQNVFSYYRMCSLTTAKETLCGTRGLLKAKQTCYKAKETYYKAKETCYKAKETYYKAKETCYKAKETLCGTRGLNSYLHVFNSEVKKIFS